MKNKILSTTLFVLLATVIIFSCKKKEDPQPEPANTTTTGGTTTGSSTTGTVSGFLWQENGGSVITADSAFWTTGTWGTGVRAYKGGFANNFFEINWIGQNATAVGTQSLDPVYGVTFKKGAVYYTATSATTQSLSITALTSTSLSGVFGSAVNNATNTSITSVTGTFTTIKKK